MVDLAAAALLRQLALEPRREVRVAARQLADLAVERRREEHRLALVGQHADDPVDLRLEAHVEHPVGLVEDEHLDRVDRDQPAVDEILQAAGRRDEHLRLLRRLRPAPSAARRRRPTATLTRRRRRSARTPRSPASRARASARARARPGAVGRVERARRSGSRTRASCRSRSGSWRGRHRRGAPRG